MGWQWIVNSQLSGWISIHEIEIIISDKSITTYRSFNKIKISWLTPSLAKFPFDEGSVRCNKIMCIIIRIIEKKNRK